MAAWTTDSVEYPVAPSKSAYTAHYAEKVLDSSLWRLVHSYSYIALFDLFFTLQVIQTTYALLLPAVLK